MKEKIIQELNSNLKEIRLFGMKKIYKVIEIGEEQAKNTEEVNNHVHTIYYFSPYSLSMTAYLAWKAGLQAVGVMDHDSVSGCKELIEACKIIGIASTIGFELRVNFSGTIVEGRKLNNPDSKNIGYIAIHGIPESKLQEAKKFYKSKVLMKRGCAGEDLIKAIYYLIDQKYETGQAIPVTGG